jgi:hypothetical protein
MSNLVQPISIEKLQNSGSRIIPVKPGNERNVPAAVAQSRADVLPFTVGSDKLLLAGRGLKLDGIAPGAPVSYQGKTGTVSAAPTNLKNTIKEGADRTLFKGVTAALAGVGAGIGFVLAPLAGAVGRPLEAALLVATTAGVGFGIGSALQFVSGLFSAKTPVRMDALDNLSK